MLGSGRQGEFTLIDMLSILSFILGLENLDLNVAQEDLDNQTKEHDKKLREVVDNIHYHLELQDDKLIEILSRLEELEHGTTRNNE